MKAGRSKGERRLVRTLYKALVCSAHAFEAEPALNALIYRRTPVSLMLGSPEIQDEESEAAESPTTALMESYYDDFLGSRETRFHHPDLASRSLLDVVRDRFRQPLPSDDAEVFILLFIYLIPI